MDAPPIGLPAGSRTRPLYCKIGGPPSSWTKKSSPSASTVVDGASAAPTISSRAVNRETIVTPFAGSLHEQPATLKDKDCEGSDQCRDPNQVTLDRLRQPARDDQRDYNGGHQTHGNPAVP